MAMLRIPPTYKMGKERSWAADAQAGVPSAKWPRAQLAFKNSMVHGILQFTPRIAFRYVLHRCESRDIRCRESFHHCQGDGRTAQPRSEACGFPVYLGVISTPGFNRGPSSPAGREGPRGRGGIAAPESSITVHGHPVPVSTMILPQVHLRKPCYDFSFL